MISKYMVYISFFCFLFGCSDPRSEREKVRDYMLHQLAKQMKKRDLIAIGSGGGCTIDKKINEIGMTFEYKKIMNMDEARELIVACIQTLLDLMNSNSENAKYFERFPVPVGIIRISILGERCSIEHDCVEVVKILNGEIYYCINHPLPEVKQIYLTLKEESFEEAQQIVASQATHGDTKP